MKIKAKCSCILKNGPCLTKDEIAEVDDNMGKAAIAAKLAEPAPAVEEKKLPAKE